MEPVKIVLSVLKNQIEEGWKLDRLKDHYGLPATQMQRVLKEAGLRIRQFRKPLFQLVDDTVQEETMENTSTPNVPVVEEETPAVVEETVETVEETVVVENTENSVAETVEETVQPVEEVAKENSTPFAGW